MKCPLSLITNAEFSRVFEFPVGVSVEKAREITLCEYVKIVDDYYGDIAGRVGYQTQMLPSELIKNAIYHSDARFTGFEIGVFLSPNVAVVGCCDGGSYFRDEAVKSEWEARRMIESREGSPGCNIGNKLIRTLTDEIFVDVNTRTLFGKFDPSMYNLPAKELKRVFNERFPYEE